MLTSLRYLYLRNRILSKWHTHYLLTHICALALTIDSFEIVVNDLSADLHLDVKEYVTCFSLSPFLFPPLYFRLSPPLSSLPLLYPLHKI